jgi:hypothetical protein
MSEVEKSIRELEALRDQHSRDALRASTGNEFDYGRVCGIHQGLGMAIEAIKKTLEDSDARPSTLEKNLRGSNGSVITR